MMQKRLNNAMDLASPSVNNRLQLTSGGGQGGGGGGGSNQNIMSLQQQFDQDYEITTCIKFVQCMRKVLNMFSFENKFIGKLLDSRTDKVTTNMMISRIFDPMLKELSRDAERVGSNVRLVHNKCTSKYIVAVFSVLSDLVEMKGDFLRTLEHSALITKTTRHIGSPVQMYLDIFVHLEKAVSKIYHFLISPREKNV
jgi:hypothetical protein